MSSNRNGDDERTPLLSPKRAAQLVDGTADGAAYVDSQPTTLTATVVNPPQAPQPDGEPSGNGSQPSSPDGDGHRTGMKRSEWVAVMGSLWITLFMAGLDGTIVMTLIQSIASSFQAAEKSSWLGTSYLLSVCAFSPVYGRLSDIIGRKGALLVALFFFTVGNGACGLASTMESLLVARFVSGIGGGGLLTCASIVMTDMIPIRQRGLWQGITNVLFGTAAGLGGPVGGWINDSYGWRQAFLFQVPFLLVGGICIALFVNIPMASNEQSLSEKLRRIDFLGSLTLVSGTTCLLLAMSFLSSDDVPFSDPKVWGLLLVSLLFGLAFIYVEARVVKEPIMPLRLLTDRSSASVCASFFVLSFTYYSFLFHFPLWFQSVRLQSAGQAGLHLLPLATTGALGSLIAGVYMKSTGKYWSFNMISSILIVLSSFYVALWDDSTSQIGEYLGLTPNGFGVSAVYTFNLIALITVVKKEDMAVATGAVYLFRSLGQVIGLALSGSFFQSSLSQQLSLRIREVILSRGGSGATGEEEVTRIVESIRHDASLIPNLPAPLREASRQSYEVCLKRLFLLMTLLNLLNVLFCWWIKEKGFNDTAAKKTAVTISQEDSEDVERAVGDA